MAVYRITFTPSGAYFFGNEKTFAFPKQNNGGNFGSLYYIKGEKMPSQTAVLGSLRYLLMPEKGYGNIGNQKNNEAIGPASFDMDFEGGQTQKFGKIKSISSVFVRGGEEYFIPTPFDHNTEQETAVEEDGKKTVYYTPLADYAEVNVLENGAVTNKLYLKDYDAKHGITDSLMSLSDNRLEKELFGSEVRVGINRNEQKDGFFKKEYSVLKSGYAFAVFAEIDDDGLDGRKDAVLMGQGKVPFAVLFEKNYEKCEEDFYKSIAAAVGKGDKVGYGRIYCASDMLAPKEGLYGGMRMAITQTHDFRSFRTQRYGKIEKGSSLHRLIKAGSIFVLPDDFTEAEAKEWAVKEFSQKNAATAGFNKTVFIEKGKNK